MEIVPIEVVNFVQLHTLWMILFLVRLADSTESYNEALVKTE